MKLNDMKKGLWNLDYSIKATSSYEGETLEILPRTVWIAITYKCNSRCKMCGIWKKYQKNPELAKEEMTLKELEKFLDKNDYLRDITLSGGEPYLTNLKEMYLLLDKKGYPTGTATNGILKDSIIKTEEELLKELSGKNNHGITISIDGLEEEHDRVRGTPGLFKKAVELVKWGIEQRKKYKFFSINVSHTITENNYKRLLEFIDYFINLGLKPGDISFRPTQVSTGYYGEIDEKEVPKETEELINELKKVMNKYPYYRKDWFYANMINYLRNPKTFRFRCYASLTFVYIDPYWNVFPCTIIPESIGNLRDYNFSLKRLLRNKKSKEARKKIKRGKCPNCWSNCNVVASRVSDSNLLFKHYLRRTVGK